MVKRKKRLKKGIESLKKQIEFHEDKLEEAERKKDENLVRYYEKEIKAKGGDLDRKEDQLRKQ
jgi:peptide subunit release factor 1 (eRF1)|tara:strand:+ start:766 stop:954 length:189 start_codon:yes stop_codon:yes gene_type:complete